MIGSSASPGTKAARRPDEPEAVRQREAGDAVVALLGDSEVGLMRPDLTGPDYDGLVRRGRRAGSSRLVGEPGYADPSTDRVWDYLYEAGSSRHGPGRRR